ncbi:MAG: Hsp70 family protein [Prochloraceae cyanobacterium]|nr:Hsp70 family protein [Prochloraceae cyanobacterium]
MTKIAIDFGTINTIVSIIRKDSQEIKILYFPTISRQFQFDRQIISVVPTLVSVRVKNRFLVGKEVEEKTLRIVRNFQGFKRELAADFQSPPVEINGIEYAPKLITELFLNRIWQEIVKQNISPSEIIFTAPAIAFEKYLNCFKALGENLGLEKITIVDESTAAALGYGVEKAGSLVLVIDFGGGTLDLSLVRTKTISKYNNSPKFKQLKAEVIAKSAVYIGGKDIDRAIAEDCLNLQNISKEAIRANTWNNLLKTAEQLKIQISKLEFAQARYSDENSSVCYELALNRDRFREILEKLEILAILRENLDEILATALGKGITKKEIEKVFLVGGSCLISSVQQLIIAYFGREKVCLDRPFDAVVRGALHSSKLQAIEGCLHHSYAIRLWHPQSQSYIFFKIFQKGIKYPCKRVESIILQAAIAQQKEIRLDIVEVEETSKSEVSFDRTGRMTSSQFLQAKAYRSLNSSDRGISIARLDPPGVLGIDRISVEFAINEKGVLIATVRDLLTEKILADSCAIARLK